MVEMVIELTKPGGISVRRRMKGNERVFTG